MTKKYLRTYWNLKTWQLINLKVSWRKKNQKARKNYKISEIRPKPVGLIVSPAKWGGLYNKSGPPLANLMVIPHTVIQFGQIRSFFTSVRSKLKFFRFILSYNHPRHYVKPLDHFLRLNFIRLIKSKSLGSFQAPFFLPVLIKSLIAFFPIEKFIIKGIIKF